jgi:hypothetical protein
MWRAGGFLLIVFAQDLGPAHVDEDHKFSVRPPAGWVRKGTAPGAVSFAPPEKAAAATHFNATHYVATNPTPLASFMKQAREYVKEKFQGAQVSEDKELQVAGRPAFRLVFTQGDLLRVHTVVFRTNREYYLLDAQMAASEAGKFRDPVDRAAASLELRPLRLTDEELAAQARFAAALKTATAAGLEAEEWHTVHLGRARIGRQRTKCAVSGDRVSFELDITSDFGEGGRDSSVVRGSFSIDGRSQKVDVERTKQNPKERWQFRASGAIEGGRAKVSRDMNGLKEDVSFEVAEGVLFDDVSEVFQKVLLGMGKGTYLIRTLSPFEDEPGIRSVEVSDPEPMEIEGRRQDTYVAFSRADRGRSVTYYYAADRKMIRQGGLKESFFLRSASREEAEKP